MQLKHQEQQRNDARLIKAVTKPAHKCSLVQVISPALLNDPTCIEFYQNDTVENCCLWENLRKFTQAHTSLWLQPEMLDTFGCVGDHPNSERILQGNFDPALLPVEDYYAKELLPFLRCPSGVFPLLWKFYQRNFQENWKKMCDPQFQLQDPTLAI